MPMPSERSASVYQRRAERYVRRLRRVSRTIDRLASARLATFALACGLAFWGAREERTWLLAPAGLMLVLFVVAVIWHRRLHTDATRLRALVAIGRQGVARLSGAWDAIAEHGASWLDDSADPRRSELQVFGRGSLFTLVNRTTLPGARDRLARLLIEGRPPAELPAAQEAARELAPQVGLRHRIEATGHELPPDPEALERFASWAQAPDRARQLLPFVLLGLPLGLLTVTLVFLRLVLDEPVPWRIAAGFNAILWLALSSWWRAGYRALLRDSRGDEHAPPFRVLSRMVQAIEPRRFRAASLRALRDALSGTEANPRRRLQDERDAGLARPARDIQRLARIVDTLGDLRNWLVYFAFNALCLWEVHHAYRLERWRRRHGAGVRAALDALAEFEVLVSAGGFAYDRPGYAWPEVREPGASPGADGRPVFAAHELGHPLVPAATRACNDFSLDRGGQLVLVSGSNMSGKSTFLRTVGVNTLLAAAGLPVCAASLSLVRAELSTSIQVTDRPAEGLSLFQAEVKRLKRVLDDVDAAEADVSLPARLYLIDEMLLGTNSRERTIASLGIADRLAAMRRSFGLITTHDLALATLAERLPERVRACHFSDRFDGERLVFDYRLKDGVATSTNALRVLELEGIAIPKPPPDP